MGGTLTAQELASKTSRKADARRGFAKAFGPGSSGEGHSGPQTKIGGAGSPARVAAIMQR